MGKSRNDARRNGDFSSKNGRDRLYGNRRRQVCLQCYMNKKTCKCLRKDSSFDKGSF